MKFILIIMFLTNGHFQEIKRMPNTFTQKECVLYADMLKAVATQGDNRYLYICKQVK